jgi:hypothetical protein
MWCCHCRCEVTAEPCADAGALCCTLCRHAIDEDQCGVRKAESGTGERVHSALRIQHSALDRPPEVRDFELADDLRRARRLLRIDPAQVAEPSRLAMLLPGENQRASQRRQKKAPSQRSLAAQVWGALTWLLVCAGGMGLTFGAGLLACTQLLSADRLGKAGDLWNWGLLTLVAGQFLLFLGLALRWSSGPGAHARPARAKNRGRRRIQRALHRPTQSVPLWSPRSEAVLAVALVSVEAS